jgi:hypothetical protein
MYAIPTIVRKETIVPAAKYKKNGTFSGGGVGFFVACGVGVIVGTGE